MSEPTANSSKGGTFPRNVQIGTFSEERLYVMISRSSGTFPRSAGLRAYANWNVLLRLERARLLRRSDTYKKDKSKCKQIQWKKVWGAVCQLIPTFLSCLCSPQKCIYVQ